MTAKNDVTGDKLKSKPSNDKFRQNFDEIFGTGKKCKCKECKCKTKG